MKKSFSILELILVLLLLSIITTAFIPNMNQSKIDEVTSKLVIYLKQTRYLSLIDNKYNEEDSLWFKKRWTLKFFRCRKDIGGFYYSIYSDTNNSGHVSIDDTLKDPLTNKHIYSSNYCKEKIENSKYVLLTKNYNITNIKLSCNTTNSLGQISFGNDASVYTKLSNFENESYEYKLNEKCYLTLEDIYNEKREIEINGGTGYVKIKE